MEDDFSVEKPRISKLTGPNYRPWSRQVETLLLGHSLWEVVKQGVFQANNAPEASTTPGDKAPKEDPERTIIKDAKARTIIMGLCIKDPLGYILLCESAKEQWETLKELYAPLGLQQLSAKIQAFTGYKPLESEITGVAEIASRLNTLQAEIGDIDLQEKPSNTLKTSIFYRALRESDPRFDPLILQLEISDATPKYSTIVTKLMEFERRLGPKKESVEALKAATGGSKGFRGKCWNCGDTGHKREACKKPKESTDNPSTGPLATPGGGRGLSPGPDARGRKPEQARTAEVSWMASMAREPETTALTGPVEAIGGTESARAPTTFFAN